MIIPHRVASSSKLIKTCSKETHGKVVVKEELWRAVLEIVEDRLTRSRSRQFVAIFREIWEGEEAGKRIETFVIEFDFF